ncbi:RmlC-like cupin domain-containing protein [Xylariaceae sp. FL0662B]|nr:RmlC-like cupin domain-containing protein [Xylariaceae sp. FL0662B]
MLRLLPIAGILAALSPGTTAHGPKHRTAQEVVDKLGLIPNEEKGYYIQTFEDTASCGNRSASTAIYYLLEGSAGSSVWHRVDAVEVWHYYAGAPLTLSLSYDDGNPVVKKVLGPDIFDGEQPQVVVAKWQWQSARSSGDWTLVGTTGMHETMKLDVV